MGEEYFDSKIHVTTDDTLVNYCPEGTVQTNNKRPMGHIAHLRKEFKSFNKSDYILTLIQRIKKNLYENLLNY